MTIKSRMSSIMEIIGPELSKLSALELENLPYLTVYTLASTNINQSPPNLVRMYVTIRSLMRLIMDLLGPELSEFLPLEFAKIAESDFVYTIACTNVDQLVPNMVTVYITMSFIVGQIRQ